MEHPESFSINLGWINEEEKTNNITLDLVQSEAVERRIPIFTNDKNGDPVQTFLLNMKVG